LACHLVGKKAAYTLTRQDMDDPSSVVRESLGSLKIALMKRFDGIIGISPALVEDCLRHKFSSKILLLPNFLLLQELEAGRNHLRRSAVRERLGIPPDAGVLLFVGSAIERKGIDVLVDTFIGLARENNNLRLVLVGPMDSKESPKIDDQYVAQQKQKLSGAGLSERVIWTGTLRAGVQLADYYHISDVFVFPTRSEGLGNVIIEAMACELPIVATYLHGVTDMLVTPGESGYLAERDNVEGFVSATRQLLNDPELRHTMGAAGRKHMLQYFSFDSYRDKLAAFYRMLAGEQTL